MKKTIFFYGLVLASLVFLLKMLEYRLWIRELSIGHYVGIVALFFTVLGIWVGQKLTRTKRQTNHRIDAGDIQELLKKKGISKREYEVLELIAQGKTNQEIADALFISLNTVKTHSSNLFSKLDARRRTQAIEHAKREGLLA
jgi:two-component system, NarL family, response regulator LiaR